MLVLARASSADSREALALASLDERMNARGDRR